MSKGYSPAKKSEQRTVANSPQNSNDLVNLIQKFESQIKLALPRHLSATRMTRIIITEVRKTPLLASCNRASFFGAIITCAQLGLEPGSGLGQVYLIPFFNNKTGEHEVQLIIGYQGMIELIERDGRITVEAHVIYEKDEFEFSLGSDSAIKHRPHMGSEPGKIIGAYCIARYTDGRMKFRVLPVHEIEAAKAFSMTGKKGFGPWKDHYSEMARKTAIRRLFKMLPKSPDIARVQEMEDKLEIGGSQNLDNVLEDFKEDSKIESIEMGTADPIPSDEEAETSKPTKFNRHDVMQLKAINELILARNPPIAADTREYIVDQMQGRDFSELSAVIADALK
jgi:recombination protein RecT